MTKFKEILSRLTGLSTWPPGVSWNPPEAQRNAVRRILSFLEDRRVLFVPSEVEIPSHCVDSVLKIRQFLTVEIGKLDAEKELTQSLRAMRAACRKFLEV